MRVAKQQVSDTRGKNGAEVSGIEAEDEDVEFWSLENKCLDRWHVVLAAVQKC